MARGHKKASRRRQEEEDDEENGDSREDPSSSKNLASSPVSNKSLDFAQRRALQRQAAAEKRRSKMKCHLCGQAGHVRRECPGIRDDGKGASIHTKANGDAGATVLKQKGSQHKGSKHRGRKKTQETGGLSILDLPPGFEPVTEQPTRKSEEEEADEEPFYYYDASCDCLATIEYLRSGRGKHKLSNKDALDEYQTALTLATRSSNYGGFISRAPIQPSRPFRVSDACPLLTPQNIWFVVGLKENKSVSWKDNEANEKNINLLVDTVSNQERVVGVYCDLNYTPATLANLGTCKESQLAALRCTCHAAGRARVPVQIRTLPSVPTTTSTDDLSTDAYSAPYTNVIQDLAQVLLETCQIYPHLQIHLACWNGRAEHMMTLLQSFPDNVWMGIDATCTFAKSSRAHECAFEVPLSRLLLETGDPRTIPSSVTKALGRDAFGHSGLIPHVASALAGIKKITTAEQVARVASENTLGLYPALAVREISELVMCSTKQEEHE